jgi:hypothetical protein
MCVALCARFTFVGVCPYFRARKCVYAGVSEFDPSLFHNCFNCFMVLKGYTETDVWLERFVSIAAYLSCATQRVCCGPRSPSFEHGRRCYFSALYCPLHSLILPSSPSISPNLLSSTHFILFYSTLLYPTTLLHLFLRSFFLRCLCLQLYSTLFYWTPLFQGYLIVYFCWAFIILLHVHSLLLVPYSALN